MADVPHHVVWWWDALPLGISTFSPAELPRREDELDALAAHCLAEQLAARDPKLGAVPAALGDGHARLAIDLDAARQYDGFPTIATISAPSDRSATDMTIIVCTRDRPDSLRVCLAALLAQRSLPGEIVVVDNSSDQSALAVTVACTTSRVRYVHEPLPGLSRARNAGLAHATRDIVAFTDDDVEVDANWTAELALAFERDPGAEAVTGLVLPASLDTPAKRMFQFEIQAFGSRCIPARFDQRFLDATFSGGPQVWHIGAGANMAFRRSTFEKVGLFDERLGAGAAGCSEDSELWYRMLAGGGACLYEPRAVVRHHHRGDFSGLRQQMRAYMKGHTAALLIQYGRYGNRGDLKRALFKLPRDFLRGGIHALIYGKRLRGQIVLSEVAGWIAGLLLPLGAQWRALAPAHPPIKRPE